VQTKLTLRLEHDLIKQAKIFAHQQNKSLSQLVEEYFLLLTKTTEETDTEAEELPPITQSLSGILAGYTVEEDDYRRHLEEKYL
jgi:hypothetical protein